jgi:hypothetical protein
MLKLSVKNTLFSISVIGVAMLFYACLAPPNLDDFFKDEKVKEKLRNTRIYLDDRSGDGLIAGNQIITGLRADRYYRVETAEITYDENDRPVHSIIRPEHSGLVTSHGIIDPEMEQIGLVTGGVIRGVFSGMDTNELDNLLTYTVYSATPFVQNEENPISIFIRDNDDPGTDEDISFSLSYGRIYITAPGSDQDYFLNFEDLDEKTIIIEIPINPDGQSRNITPSGTAIKLNEMGTTTDYIIIEYGKDDDNGNGNGNGYDNGNGNGNGNGYDNGNGNGNGYDNGNGNGNGYDNGNGNGNGIIGLSNGDDTYKIVNFSVLRIIIGSTPPEEGEKPALPVTITVNVTYDPGDIDDTLLLTTDPATPVSMAALAAGGIKLTLIASDVDEVTWAIQKSDLSTVELETGNTIILTLEDIETAMEEPVTDEVIFIVTLNIDGADYPRTLSISVTP